MERAFDMGRHNPCGSGYPTVSVIVPTLNEAPNLPYFFSRLPADLHEVILVDGGSVDGTVAVALGVAVLAVGEVLVARRG